MLASAASRVLRATALVAASTCSAIIVGTVIGMSVGTGKTVFVLVMNGDWAGLLQLCVVGILLLVLLLLLLRFLAMVRSRKRTQTATVVVMGDIGRSPRMLNHANSLANAGFDVCIVGYADSAPPLHILNHARISIHGIAPPWKLPRSPKLLYLLLAPIAACSRMLSLLFTLLGAGTSGVVLVQNPPSIPTLLVARGVTWLWSGGGFVVDWHNYGFTIMQTTGAPSKAIALARLYERWFGRLADGHLCVSRAMAHDLKEKWGIPGAIVLYDRPPARFCRTPPAESAQLFERLGAQGVLDPLDFLTFSPASSPEPSSNNAPPALRPDRPALLVSSTSWTPDEDFGMFFSAMKELDMMLKSSCLGDGEGSRVHAVITGKGPLREHYLKEIANAALERVRISTAWLEADDYPRLLGAADLGISLHYSSSGLDLPMKVVDMFGCQLPVLSVRYQCIEELVAHDKTGLLFDSARQLAQQVFALVRTFPGDQEKLESMRECIMQESVKWEDEWVRCALALFKAQVGVS